MIDNETIRKASEMGIIDVIDAVNTVESNTTYITLSFDWWENQDDYRHDISV